MARYCAISISLTLKQPTFEIAVHVCTVSDVPDACGLNQDNAIASSGQETGREDEVDPIIARGDLRPKHG